MSSFPDAIILYGPPGSGKSTVGRILADHLNLAFCDLDAEIARLAGQSIPEIFATSGEAGFRAQERAALEQVLAGEVGVIALGGGTLTVPANQDLATTRGRVVCLQAPEQILRTRLAAEPNTRPLLPGNSVERLRDLLAERRDHYASFDLKISTETLSPAEIAWHIQVLLGEYYLQAMAGNSSPAYPARVASLAELPAFLRKQAVTGPLLIVTDENIAPHHLGSLQGLLDTAGYDVNALILPAGEQHKNLTTVSRIWQAALQAGLERTSTMLALGGGVIGDLTGFAAATYLRGIAWLALPTSLLAMVDASLGGKTGVDLPQGKNLVGAFHPPRLVWADPAVLATLPQEELRAGLSEVVKHALIADPELFGICLRLPGLELAYADWFKLISRAMAVKVRVIEEDPFEQNVRATLNLGHTIGHGIELASNFSLRHGEAVAIGMVLEARLAEQIGLAQAGLAQEIATVVSDLGLPDAIPADLDRSRIIAAMQLDKKKAAGVVKFVLPRSVGSVQFGVAVPGWETFVEQS